MTHIKQCANCGKDTKKSNTEIKSNKSGLYFCSIICRQKVISSFPRRKTCPQTSCKTCGKQINEKKKFCCDLCRKSSTEKIIKKNVNKYKTLGEVRAKAQKQDQNRYTLVRRRAQNTAEKYCKIHNIQKCCFVCGYDKFVHLCHIKDIASYDDNALIEDINNPANLIYLCLNHHAELDNNVLDVEIKSLLGQSELANKPDTSSG